MSIKLIIGLGNKNKNLQKTRHNVGIWFLKKFFYKQTKNKIILNKLNKIKIKNKKIFLYIPKSYINNSGKYIYKIKKKLKLNSSKILIIHDEINLKPGKFKIVKNKAKYSTHNGIKNIIYNIKSHNFYQLKIGIGKPKNKYKLKKYVLSKPKTKEKYLIKKSIKKYIFYIKKLIIDNNLIKIQNIINKK